jgi:type IV pilus assembly protein PilV
MNLKRDKGFSMMELLVAMVVIALGLLAISGLFPLGSRARMKGEEITKAIQHAQQKMEQLTEKGYDSLSTGLHDSTQVEGYKVEWWVTTLGWSPSKYDTLKVLTDTVTFLTPGGGFRKVGLKTYLSPKISRGG